MLRYTIQITYMTGNSFGSHQEMDELGISWESLDRAKEALRRIREMYEVEEEHGRYWTVNNPEKTPREFSSCAGYTGGKYPDQGINLRLDDGTEHRHSTFWRGYFERLIRAEVIVIGVDDEMVFEPN